MKKAMLVLGVFLALATYAPAQEMLVISGKLLGYDGKPMLKAQVHLLSGAWEQKSLQSIGVAPDGSFEIKFKDKGIHFLHCIGVNHYGLRIPLQAEKPLREKLTVGLKLYEYVDDFSQVKIIGDFNNFDASSARPMTKQADGTFVLEMDTTASTFAYQILGAEKSGRSGINGTQADDFVHDGWDGYRLVVKVSNGKAKIIFDPKKLLRRKPSNEAIVKFDASNSLNAKLYALHHEHTMRQDKFRAAREAYRDGHQGNMSGFSYDWSADLTTFPKRIAEEKNQTLRHVLLLQYPEIGWRTGEKKLDKKVIKQAFAEIPATSPLWTMLLTPRLMSFAIEWTGEKEKYGSYLNQVIEHHPYRELRADVLYMMLSDAWNKGDTAQVRTLYNRMRSEFNDHFLAEMARREFDPNRAIMKGRPAPRFAAASMDHPGVTYTNEAMKGKIYLLDFWAVWCGPCVQEMPNLHQAHEKFKDRNFEILSLSFDELPEDVAQFRSGQWKMPWLHSFIQKDLDSDLEKAFEVTAIPKPILVDGNTNTILATGEELLGEQLEKTLAQVLGEKTVMSDKVKH